MNNIKEIAEEADFNVLYDGNHGSCFVKKDGSIVITSSWDNNMGGLKWNIHFKEYKTSIEDSKTDIDNLPLLSVNDVYSFMCNSGAYMPYNRPTHDMLRSIVKSKIK